MSEAPIDQPAAAPAPVLEVKEVAPAAAPVVAVEPAPSPAPEAPKVELHTDKPTLLETVKAPGEEEKPVEAKPGEEKKPEAEAAKPDDKPAEAKPEEKPAEVAPVETAPIAYDFKLPEGFQVDKDKIGAYTSVLQEAKIAPEVGQKLLDMHTGIVKSITDGVLQNQHKAFSDTRADWVSKIMSDEVLGGSGHRTAAAAVARMRDAFISSEKPGTPAYQAQVKEFDDFLRITGAGDHPAFWRMLHNVARFVDEPSLPPSGGKPPPNGGKRPGKRTLKDIYAEGPSGQKA